MPPAIPRVLSIAGTDPTGGAGTAADLKSITAAGGYGMAAVTAVVAQNTHGVREIHLPPATMLAAQLEAVGDDVTLEAVKTGMLGTAEIIRTVQDWVARQGPDVLVVDPVMVATSGDRLLAAEAEEAMLHFCRLATVVTPNIDELAVLTGSPRAATEAEALAQAADWAERTGVAVVVKTGHLEDERVTNTWISPDGSRHAASSRRVDTESTHGTGCSLAAALATRLGAGDDPATALAWATDWLHEAITHGADLRVGSGHGPVDHSHRARRLASAGSAAPWLAADAIPARLESPTDLRVSAGASADGSARAGASGTGAADGSAKSGTADGSARSGTADGPARPVAAEMPAPSIAPVGPWTAALWEAGAPLAADIADSGFVRALVDGSLPEAQFSFYLAQDAQYLDRYSEALQALADRAGDPAEAQFWAESSSGCIEVEAELHRSWLADRPSAADLPASPVTSAYTDFLLARALTAPPAVAAAAVLPCFWLYAEVGASLPDVAADHPYAAWLETYRDPGFVAGVLGAQAAVERELEAATPEVRAEAVRAYLLACRHELEFFEQARRVDPSALGSGARLAMVAR
ncbi:bifunctional hydroxymethylpyrimidine kinase/phosphomethylpyrimidine kinase [Brachybacterium aquaticum]|uniref:Hydroxymethylpyrimidine/phosphomethylpyrimidine kinase n=1 Tax=Brachybacterium aquaticum TaxID=1432564 RepID=A0A841A9J7_9MICO|nr:bifunctional hydroxymethylpyrimidine kinase/phosphomethylpyrimidine kinase [Brachybacterium aquaticum]MBB5830291.1 hydroxymethylpyrimidine/phosphomethylpyrimidine kinase [Brachybacterium aquaticum]